MAAQAPYSDVPLVLASKNGNLQQVMELLKEEGAPADNSQYLEVSLCEAIRHGHAAIVSHLLEKGAKIADYAVVSAVREATSTSVFQAMLDHGWDINSKWQKGEYSKPTTSLWYVDPIYHRVPFCI